MIKKSMIWLLVFVMMFSTLSFATDDDLTTIEEEEIPKLSALIEAIDINGISPVMIERSILRFNIQFHDKYEMYMTLVNVVTEDEEITMMENSIKKAVSNGYSYDELRELVADSVKLADNSSESSREDEDRDVQPLNFILNPSEYRKETADTIIRYLETQSNLKKAYQEFTSSKEKTIEKDPIAAIAAPLFPQGNSKSQSELAEDDYGAAQRAFNKAEEAYLRLFEKEIISRVRIESNGILPYLYVSQPGITKGNYKLYFEDAYQREFKVIPFEVVNRSEYLEFIKIDEASNLKENDN